MSSSKHRGRDEGKKRGREKGGREKGGRERKREREKLST
jgi:hypothetical protein